MNRKKGFTLIELLAVIVILAVIALIATPIIMNVINDSKKGAAKDTGYAIIKSAELEMAKGEFKSPSTYTEDNDLNYKGTKPSKMSLEIDNNGKTNMYAYIDGYCVAKSFTDTEITIDDSKKTADTCVAGVRSSIIVDVKDGMIPVSYDASGNTVKANTSSTWYDYDAKKWANAVVVTSDTRDKYLKASAGTAIPESDILGYYVYIPRYRYQLWNAEGGVSNEQEIKLEFERRSTAKSLGTKNGEWLTHPAFTFGSSELNGIWVGKFEMTGTSSNPTIKPNQKSLTNVSNRTMFNNIKNMQSDTYGLSNYDSHMIKNMEWGAMAYLTQSKYGRCTNGLCTEIWINNVNTGNGIAGVADQYGPTITGCSGASAQAGVKNNMTACESGRDYKQAGVNSSTTGNITGIYDTSGGNFDRTMGLLMDSNGKLLYSYSEFTESTMPEEKYYDKYELTTGDFDFAKGKLGDSTREVVKISNKIEGAWYGEYLYMPNSTSPWFYRSGYSNDTTGAGIFSLVRSIGNPWYSHSSRAVVVVE